MSDPLQDSRNAILQRQSEIGSNPYQNSDLQSNNWRSRATAVNTAPQTSWRDRATAVQTKEPSYTEKLQQGFQNREQQMQQSADAYVAGEQSLPETMAQQGLAYASNLPDALFTTAGQITPGFVKKGAEAAFDVGKALAANTIGQLPVPGREGNLAEEFPKDVQTVVEGDSRLARNVRAGGQALNLLGTGAGLKAAGEYAISKPVVQNYLKSTATTGAVQAERSTAKAAAKESIVGFDKIDEMARQAYAQADEIGATFNPKQVANKFEAKIKESMPKSLPSGKMTSEAKELINHLDELTGNEGRALTLEQVQDLDEALTQKINKMVDTKTGELDANGRKLYLLQDELRGIVDATDVAGNNALINGRKLWQARSMLRDLDAIAERASLSKNPHTVLQNGYKNLYLNKKRIRGWPDEAKALLKKAANPSAGTEILDLAASRLPAIIMGGTGNVPGAATAHVIGMASRGAKEGIVAGRGAKVQQSIVDETLKGLRPVEVPTPEPVAQRLLASPEKMSRLPMTDKEIGISQALLNRGNVNKATIEGGPISPVPTKLIEGPKAIEVPPMGSGQITKSPLRPGESSLSEAFGTNDKYVYHITNKTDDLSSFIKEGIRPSDHGIDGPGVYMATTPEGTLYHVDSLAEGTMFRINKEKLINKYGRYPENKNGVQFDETTGELLLSEGKVTPDMIEVETPNGWKSLVKEK